MSQPTFSSPPPAQTYAVPSFPAPGVLLLTFNRPKSLNCVSTASSWELDGLFTWFDNEPLLRVAIVTGTGRAFCAGADLKGRSDTSILRAQAFQRHYITTCGPSRAEGKDGILKIIAESVTDQNCDAT